MYKYYEKILYFYYSLQLLRLKFFGAKIGKNIKVYGKFTTAGHPKRLSIGDNVTINEGVFIHCRDYVRIGNDCRLSSFSKIYTASLNLEEYPREHNQAPVTLCDNVWLASSCIVAQGVTIGKNSAVAAGSIVLSDAEPNSLYAGSPAKKIKEFTI